MADQAHANLEKLIVAIFDNDSAGVAKFEKIVAASSFTVPAITERIDLLKYMIYVMDNHPGQYDDFRASISTTYQPSRETILLEIGVLEQIAADLRP